MNSLEVVNSMRGSPAPFGKLSPRTVVVGADGFLGGALSTALNAQRIVYGACRDGDVPISQAQDVLINAEVVINAGGFRVTPGFTMADYRRTHEGAAAAIVPCLRKGATLLHISSASVLGKSRNTALGNNSSPDPSTFPSPEYAVAKLAADRFLEKAAAERGFKVIFLRPATVYGPQGTGMLGTFVRLAKRGIALHLYPQGARHHLVHMDLVVEAARRTIEQNERLMHLTALIVADPYTVTNYELEQIISRYASPGKMRVPIALPLLATILRHSIRSRHPKLDLHTWGEILGVLNLDTVYDPSETFDLIGIDPTNYTLERTLLPVIRKLLQ
jgi:nucleoside-diphosphate-sugar epimerase